MEKKETEWCVTAVRRWLNQIKPWCAFPCCVNRPRHRIMWQEVVSTSRSSYSWHICSPESSRVLTTFQPKDSVCMCADSLSRVAELKECDPVCHSLAHLGSSGVGEGHQEHHRGPGHGLLQQWEHLLGLEILEDEENTQRDGAIIISFC